MIIAIIIAGISGCASVDVQKGKDLSSAGVAYSQATSALIDVAINSMIDADSEAHVRTKLPQEALTRMEYTPKKLREKLKKSDSTLISNTTQLLLLKASVDSMGAYFKALQTLADNPQSDTTASSVSTLADRVNSLNAELKKPNEGIQPIISESQKTALNGLSKLVSDQAHAIKVSNALKRDSKIIGESILLQKEILSFAEKIIIGDLNSKANRFYVDNVEDHFEKQNIDDKWVSDRRLYIKSKATGQISEAVTTPSEASTQMSKIWEKVLSGVYSSSEMHQQIQDLDAIVKALLALKQAEKPIVPANELCRGKSA
jgi:hypothetical protein